MNRILVALASVTLVWISSVFASEHRRSEDISIAFAVEEFNLRNRQLSESARQPPLTEDEVIAGIRFWQISENEDLPEEVRDRVRDIAETRVMPPAAVLAVAAVHYQDGYRFEGYRVILNVVAPEQRPVNAVNIVIRNHFISSRKIRPEEQR